MWRCLQIHLTRCGQEIVMHKYSTEIIEACVYTSVYLDMYKKQYWYYYQSTAFATRVQSLKLLSQSTKN